MFVPLVDSDVVVDTGAAGVGVGVGRPLVPGRPDSMVGVAVTVDHDKLADYISAAGVAAEVQGLMDFVGTVVPVLNEQMKDKRVMRDMLMFLLCHVCSEYVYVCD